MVGRTPLFQFSLDKVTVLFLQNRNSVAWVLVSHLLSSSVLSTVLKILLFLQEEKHCSRSSVLSLKSNHVGVVHRWSPLPLLALAGTFETFWLPRNRYEGWDLFVSVSGAVLLIPIVELAIETGFIVIVEEYEFWSRLHLGGGEKVSASWFGSARLCFSVGTIVTAIGSCMWYVFSLVPKECSPVLLQLYCLNPLVSGYLINLKDCLPLDCFQIVLLLSFFRILWILGNPRKQNLTRCGNTLASHSLTPRRFWHLTSERLYRSTVSAQRVLWIFHGEFSQ